MYMFMVDSVRADTCILPQDAEGELSAGATSRSGDVLSRGTRQ